MIEVADILRRHGPAYRAEHPLLPSQQKALRDLVRCRTAACGGHVYECDQCGHTLYSYHSCGNRHCPKCHGQQTERWLEQHREQLLPCAYYFLTFTLPATLRPLVYAHQKALYSLLLSSAAAALQKLAKDPRYVGGQLALLAVLHTWKRDLLDHPHVHVLASAGGLSADGQAWVHPKNRAFLVPGFALTLIFQGKIRAGLKKLGLLAQVPAAVWSQKWNVQIQHAGSGQKVLDYLGRYAFRIAISNSRLEAFDNGQVTFRYRANKTQQLQHRTLSAEEFIRRFMRHVLPKGFVKVRSYGLWSSRATGKLDKARALLSPASPAAHQEPEPQSPSTPRLSTSNSQPSQCPQCKTGHLIWVGELPRRPWWLFVTPDPLVSSTQQTRGP